MKKNQKNATKHFGPLHDLFDRMFTFEVELCSSSMNKEKRGSLKVIIND